jgi:sulfur carrier protein|eukprot:SAG22_NODE_12071_length_457_cov_1.022346_2_plen_71_part_00
MKVKINGTEENLSEDTLTVTALLKLKEVKMPDMVSVELNGEMLERETFDTTQVKEGDEIEFLYFMGGGLG